MKADQLMVPVYINEKIVLDMLAIIEDGFSTATYLIPEIREKMQALLKKKCIRMFHCCLNFGHFSLMKIY